MSNKQIREKIQRLGNALQVLSDEYNQLCGQLEAFDPPACQPVRKRRSLKPIRKAYYAELLKKSKA